MQQISLCWRRRKCASVGGAICIGSQPERQNWSGAKLSTGSTGGGSGGGSSHDKGRRFFIQLCSERDQYDAAAILLPARPPACSAVSPFGSRALGGICQAQCRRCLFAALRAIRLIDLSDASAWSPLFTLIELAVLVARRKCLAQWLSGSVGSSRVWRHLAAESRARCEECHWIR